MKINIIVNKGYSYRKLLRKTKRFYGIPWIFRKRVIVPTNHNHILYVHQYGVDVEILENANIEEDVKYIKEYIENVFFDETIGLRGKPDELCLLNELKRTKVITMNT